MTQDRSRCQFYHIFEVGGLENDKSIYVELARDLESDCNVTISLTCRISSKTNDTIEIDFGVDFTIFEADKLENDEIIYVELARDLESDCGVTISVTFIRKNETGYGNLRPTF